MGGVRLHHPTLRAGEGTTLTYVVELPQAYPVPYDCPGCGKTHDRKAIHLRLDANGDVIVSEEVYAKLQEVFLAGMEVANHVASPPPLVIGAVPKDRERIVEQPLSGLPAAQTIIPGRTRYESRDRLLAPFAPLIDAAAERADRAATAANRTRRRLFVPRSALPPKGR